MKHIYPVILAGGGGTRLWPVSKKACPKQFVKLQGPTTLFQKAVRRAALLAPLESIRVVSIKKYMPLIKAQEPALASKNILTEPAPKGTLAAVALAAASIYNKDPKGVMVLLYADHIIENTTALKKAVATAYAKAMESKVVTIGVKSLFAATQFGWVRMGKAQSEKDAVYDFASFEEKPNSARAEKFHSSGKHLWNTGLYVFPVSMLMQLINKHQPKAYSAAVAMTTKKTDGVKKYAAIPPTSIDYAISEHLTSKEAVVVCANLGWSDVGSWESIFEKEAKKKNGVVAGSNATIVESTGCMVCAPKGKTVAVFGMKNVVVIDTGTELLVCPREKSAKLGTLVEKLPKTAQ